MKLILRGLHNQTPQHHLRRTVKSAAIDAVIMFTTYTVVFFGRSVTAPLVYVEALDFIIIAIVLMIFCLYTFGTYHRIWAQTSGHGIVVIFNATIVNTLLIVILDVIIRPRELPISVIVLGNALALSGFVTVRYRSRLIKGATWRWRAIWHQEFPGSIPKMRVLIVGAGEAGQQLAMRLKYRIPDNNYMVIGFVDDAPDKQGMYVEGCPVLGVGSDIPVLVEAHRIDLIVLAVHNISGPVFRKLLSYCECTTARIKVVPDVLALMSARQGAVLLRDVQPEDLIGRKLISPHDAVDFSPMRHKVILITGAAGSIGSELSHQIPQYRPHKVILVDNNESGLHDLTISLSADYPDVELTSALADVADKDAVQPIFEQHHPEIVFHAAAYKHVPLLELYPHEALRVNVGGTLNLVELAHEYQTERFVLISTDKAVNPSSVMGASKRICELILYAFAQQQGRTLYASVRFGNVLGSRGSVVPTFNRQIDKGGPVTVTHKDMTRYFMSIPEAVNLVIHAACMTSGSDTFLLQMGEVVRILDLAVRMIRLRGLRPYEDIDIEFTGIRPGEKLTEQLFEDHAESPTPTVHPNIIRLNGVAKSVNGADFLHEVETLLDRGFLDRANALEELLELASLMLADNYSPIAGD